MNVGFEERAIYGLVVVLGAALALFSTAFRARDVPAAPKPAPTCPTASYCPGPTWYPLIGGGRSSGSPIDFSVPLPATGGGHPTSD